MEGGLINSTGLEPRHTSTCVTAVHLSWRYILMKIWAKNVSFGLLARIVRPSVHSSVETVLPVSLPLKPFLASVNSTRISWRSRCRLRSCVLGFLRTWLSDTNHLQKIFAVSLIFDDESVFGNRNPVVCLKLVYWSNGQRLQISDLWPSDLLSSCWTLVVQSTLNGTFRFTDSC